MTISWVPSVSTDVAKQRLAWRTKAANSPEFAAPNIVDNLSPALSSLTFGELGIVLKEGDTLEVTIVAVDTSGLSSEALVFSATRPLEPPAPPTDGVITF